MAAVKRENLFRTNYDVLHSAAAAAAFISRPVSIMQPTEPSTFHNPHSADLKSDARSQTTQTQNKQKKIMDISENLDGQPFTNRRIFSPKIPLVNIKLIPNADGLKKRQVIRKKNLTPPNYEAASYCPVPAIRSPAAPVDGSTGRPSQRPD